MGKKDSTVAVAEVALHNGVPTVFIDGKPSHYYAAWFAAPGEGGDRQAFKDVISAVARETGTHIYTFENGTAPFGAEGASWIPGPGEGRDGHFDFSSVESDLALFLDADPEARFHIRLFLEMNTEWWTRLYPEECLVNSDGPRGEQSYASTVWRDEVNDFLRQFTAHIESIGMAERVLAYQVNTGTTCEWFKYSLCFGNLCGDYSEPMQRWFRSWLREKYGSDTAVLRDAWGSRDVTFETAEVPPPDQQLKTRYRVRQFEADREYLLHEKSGRALQELTFRDPQVEQNVIDYLAASSDLCAELVIDFCRTVKQSVGSRAMAGVFYGYWMGFGFTSDYFRDYPDSLCENTKLQRSGHLGLQKVLDSPWVDFFSSPMEYLFRGPGGHSPPMIPADAISAHGKIFIQENDDRSWHPSFRDYGACRTVEDFLAVYRRTLAEAIVAGQGAWSVSLPIHVQKAEDLGGADVALGHATNVKDLPGAECARFVAEAAECNRVGRFALEVDRTPVGEIAILVDAESFYYETFRKNMQFPLINLQRVQHLPRIGAPVEFHTLNDFLEGRLRPYKVYIFINAWHLDETRRRKLKKQLRRDGRVAVWMCAPGLINRDVSVDNMTEVTGFKFASMTPIWGPFMHVTDFTHPITRDMDEGLFWGTDLNIGPVFRLDDADARILGDVMYSQGRCAEGFGVKEFPEWKSVYIAAPNPPAALLRGIARWAGVHLYSDAGDVLYACRELLAVHTLKGGARTFSLPEKVEVVYDLFGGGALAHDTDRFEVELPATSTTVFYCGDSAALSHLES